MSPEISEIKENVQKSLGKIDQLIEEMKTERDKIQAELEQRMDRLLLGKTLENIDYTKFEEWLEEYYCIRPTRHPNVWEVIVPKWIPFQIGWLETETRGYNVFKINQYVDMFRLTHVPAKIREKLDLKEGIPYKVDDGMLLTGSELQEQAWFHYRKFLRRREGKDRIRIKKGQEFHLIAELIKNRCLPFMPQPIDSQDLRPYKEITPRDYQEKAWSIFQQTGAMGLYYPYGSGKSFFGLYACGRIKGPKLAVVPTIPLKDQWNRDKQKYLPAKYAEEVEVQTYHSYHKVKTKTFTLVIFDECHRLPANTFIRLATLRTKYRLGLSGSPFREDGRENYIIALTGFPIGMAWEDLLRRKVVVAPHFRVYLLRDMREKFRKLDELMDHPLKTIIFCDWIKLGKRIAQRYGIPFVYHETKDGLGIIEKTQATVVSRVGDHGISVKDLERIIEFAFMGRSRMQESQRFGRLMHSVKGQGSHIILMTEKEYATFQRRLLAISERGFNIEYIR